MTEVRVLRPLSQVLTLAAVELSDLARSGEALEHLVVRLAPKEGAAQSLLCEVQGVDLFVQRLAGLAGFVRGLSQAVPAEVTVDILAAVHDLTLTDQAQRLVGCPRHAEEEARGDLLLFGD
jgi:hypothetical protein